MKNYKMISRITMWLLMALGIVVVLTFFFGGSEGSLEVAGDYLDIPKFTDLMLFWNYILVALVCLATIGFTFAKFVEQLKVNTKKALTTLGVVVGFIVLAIVCWVLGSPEEIEIIGYEGTDNMGAMAQMSDAFLYMTYTLIVGTILTMVAGLIYTKTLK